MHFEFYHLYSQILALNLFLSLRILDIFGRSSQNESSSYFWLWLSFLSQCWKSLWESQIRLIYQWIETGSMSWPQQCTLLFKFGCKRKSQCLQNMIPKHKAKKVFVLIIALALLKKCHISWQLIPSLWKIFRQRHRFDQRWFSFFKL